MSRFVALGRHRHRCVLERAKGLGLGWRMPLGPVLALTVSLGWGVACSGPSDRSVEEQAWAVERARSLHFVEEGRALMRGLGDAGAGRALRLYEQALAIQPENLDALWEMGWALQLLGRWDTAVAAWAQLGVAAPDYPQWSLYYPELLRLQAVYRELWDLPRRTACALVDEVPAAGPPVVVSAVGDVTLGRGWPPSLALLPPGDASLVFEDVSELLWVGDIGFANLETVLADSGESRKCTRGSEVCYAFRVPAIYASTLARSGLGVVSMANNHSSDFGLPGTLSTIGALQRANLLYAGRVGDVASWDQEVAGARYKIALLAFATGGGMYRVQNIPLAQRLVAHAAASHDLVLVSFHAGAEGADAVHVTGEEETYLGESRGNVRDFAHALVDAGADLLLGHGPHVLRGMEVYRGRLIAYSLGNFSSWFGLKISGPNGVSGILHAELAPNGVVQRAQLVPIFLDPPGVPRPDPLLRAIDVVRELSVSDFGDALLSPEGVYEAFQ